MGVFYASYPMSYSTGVEAFERLPNTIRAFGFTSVCRDRYIIGFGKFKSTKVFVHRKACFIGGDVKSYDMFIGKVLDELNRPHALRIDKMTQGTKDKPSYNTGFCHALRYRTVHGFHDLMGVEATLEVQEWSEADLGIDHVFPMELLE